MARGRAYFLDIDESGLRPRPQFFAMAKERLGLTLDGGRAHRGLHAGLRRRLPLRSGGARRVGRAEVGRLAVGIMTDGAPSSRTRSPAPDARPGRRRLGHSEVKEGPAKALTRRSSAGRRWPAASRWRRHLDGRRQPGGRTLAAPSSPGFGRSQSTSAAPGKCRPTDLTTLRGPLAAMSSSRGRRLVKGLADSTPSGGAHRPSGSGTAWRLECRSAAPTSTMITRPASASSPAPTTNATW